jgi:hypothetical protein
LPSFRVQAKEVHIDDIFHQQEISRAGVPENCLDPSNIKELSDSGKVFDIGSEGKIILIAIYFLGFAQVGLDVDEVRLKGLDGEEVGAHIDVDCMVEHLVPVWNEDLAARVGADHVVACSEEVLEVFEFVFAGEVAEDEVS